MQLVQIETEAEACRYAQTAALLRLIERNELMDITRNWRLKSTRSQLLATRCPTTGEVRLPQQTASAAVEIEPYVFEGDTRESVVMDGIGGYAKAAR